MNHLGFMAENKTFLMKPIGHVRCSRLKSKEDYFKKKKGQVFPAQAIITPELADGLGEIETFDHIWLIWVFDRNIDEGFKLTVHPPADPDNARAMFVTRSPYRPNPIGLSCVKVLKHNFIQFTNYFF